MWWVGEQVLRIRPPSRAQAPSRRSRWGVAPFTVTRRRPSVLLHVLRGPGVTRFHLPVGHLRGAKRRPHNSLWRNPGGRNLLEHLLDGKPLKTFIYAAVDKADFKGKTRKRVRVRVSALDSAGQPLAGVQIRAIDLQSGTSKPTTADEGEGRYTFRIPRSRMLPTRGGRFRRTVLRISWAGGRIDRVVVVNEQGG